MSSQDSERPTDGARPAPVKIHRLPTPGEAITSVFRRWWLVLLIAGGGVGLGIVGASRFRPTYQSFALIRLRAASEAKIGGSNEGVAGVDPNEVIRRLRIALGAKETIDPIITKLARLFTPAELARREALIASLGTVSVDRKTGDLYSLTVRARSAVAAQQVALEFAEKALTVYRADAEDQAIRLEAFAHKQVEEASEKIKKLENEMVDFLEKHPVMKLKSLDADPNAAEGDKLRTTKRRSPLGLSLERSGEKDPQLKELLARQQRLRTELRSLTESTTSNTGALTQSLTEAKNALTELRGQGLKDAHPQVKQALKRIADLKAKLNQTAPGGKTDNSEYVTKVRDELRQVMEAIRKRVQATASTKSGAPQPKEDVTELEVEWARKRRAHAQLIDQHGKLEEVAVNAALKKNLGLFEARKMASIVAQPRVAEAPTGLVRRTIVVAASVAALLLALAAAVLLGLLDVRLVEPGHITRASESLVVLAVLADHPLRAVASAARIRHQDLTAAPAAGGPEPQSAPPSGPAGGVIQWLRGTDDLDQAISLLKPDASAPRQLTAGGEGGGGQWLDAATQMFDRHSPAPLGAGSSSALVVASPAHGALVHGSRAIGPAGPTPPRICVLPSAPPFAPGLFVSVQPQSKPAEQMRLLASRLDAQIGKSLRVVAVSSWEAGVGKSTVAANLVMVLAESQKRVLAVDACPGKASLTRIFGIEPDDAGLCEQLQRWLDTKQGATTPWELDQIAETLTICTSSVVLRPALPLLASAAFTRFIADMNQFFDAIVIDTEALQGSSDAVVLQRLVDGYVMVVARRQSTTRSLQAIASRLDPARVLGYVFNEHRA